MESAFLLPIEKFYKEDIQTAKDIQRKAEKLSYSHEVRTSHTSVPLSVSLSLPYVYSFPSLPSV